MELNHILGELDGITKHFTVVTSNLSAQYEYASQVVVESFETKDCDKLY